MSKPLLILTLGLPGSGKSYFSSRLSKDLPAVWLNSDSIRHAMFGGPGEVTDPKLRYGAVFGAMDHVAEQILAAGMNVIYDANNNKVIHRDAKRRLAKDLDATFVLVHIQVPNNISDERALNREVTQHQIAVTTEMLEKHKRNEELPLPDEDVITIDGEAPYAKQLDNFRNQLKVMLKKNGGVDE